MSICYDDSPVPLNRAIRIDRMDPHKQYKRHTENYYLLRFISTTSDQFKEKQQAHKEMLVAERKIKFWERHMNFDRDQAQVILNKIKKDWSRK